MGASGGISVAGTTSHPDHQGPRIGGNLIEDITFMGLYKIYMYFCLLDQHFIFMQIFYPIFKKE